MGDQRLLPDHPEDEGLRIEELTDLLDTIRQSVTMPYPATMGDGPRHDGLLLQRVMHVRLALERVLGEVDHINDQPGDLSRGRHAQTALDVPWETSHLRTQIAELAPSGYKAGAWPGVPVEALLAHGQVGLDHCPRCGRRITDVDPAGMEAESGQRWCIAHHSDAMTDAFGPEAVERLAETRPIHRLGAAAPSDQQVEEGFQATEGGLSPRRPMSDTDT